MFEAGKMTVVNYMKENRAHPCFKYWCTQFELNLFSSSFLVDFPRCRFVEEGKKIWTLLYETFRLISIWPITRYDVKIKKKHEGRVFHHYSH